MTKIVTKKTLPSKDVLVQLNKSIWKERLLQQMYGDRSKVIKACDESRTLTTTEWEYIKRCVKALELPVIMSNTDYGFGVAIQIYEPLEHPAADCELLMAVTQKHFEERFNDGWERFYPLVTDKRNLELIAFCGLPKLMEKCYYEY